MDIKKFDFLLKKLKSLGINKGDVADSLSITRGYISKILAGEKPLTESNYDLFKELYKDKLGADFIEFNNKVSEAKPITPLDNEDMLYNKHGNTFTPLEDGGYLMTVKLVNVKARAGYRQNYADPEYVDSLPTTTIKVPKINRGIYRAFEIEGDSMDYDGKRAIVDKDIVTGRSIPKDMWRSKIHISKYPEYIIVTKKEGVLCKEIIKHDVEKGILTLHSYNPNKEMFPDTEIHLDDVEQIFNIIKVENDRG